ncbi:Uncharacterised protein [Mycobacteroides abscessus subsp. abscessus]|nr:Uncharacterised protein [Mycobacteroides abscessus subsp. abscessus]
MVGDGLDREVHEHVGTCGTRFVDTHRSARIPPGGAGRRHVAIGFPHDETFGVIHEVLADAGCDDAHRHSRPGEHVTRTDPRALQQGR